MTTYDLLMPDKIRSAVCTYMYNYCHRIYKGPSLLRHIRMFGLN